MALLDLLGRRWALRILWELRNGEAMTFRELQEAAGGLSPSVLNARVQELRDAGILERSDAGYALTRDGYALLEALGPLDAWAKRWGRKRG